MRLKKDGQLETWEKGSQGARIQGLSRDCPGEKATGVISTSLAKP